MRFTDVNNGGLNFPNAGGGCYGGLQFWQGGNQKVLVGDGWGDLNWSIAASVPNEDITPMTAIVTGEWHAMVVKSVYTSAGNTAVTIWLDPDFTKTEYNQANPPIAVSTDNTFDNIMLRCGNGSASADFANVILAATAVDVGFAVPAGPQFQNFVPGASTTFVRPNTPISVQVVVGGVGISTNAISLTLDGNSVIPAFTVSGGTITVNYQPTTPLAPGSAHSVAVNLTDMSGTPYSTSWSFTVDPYPALPVTLAGPFTVSGGGSMIILNSQDGSIDSQYGAASTNVLYTRFSMEFTDVNNGGLNVPNAGGGCYGGLQFWQAGNQKLLVGAGWADVNWSVAVSVPNTDVAPVTPILTGEWHTMVVKSAYTSGGNTAVTVWLDPDFTKSEGNQPNAPLVLSIDNTFDNIMLRCGNGTASANFSNVVMAAAAPGVGFAASPAVLAMQNLGGKNVHIAWTGVGTLQEAATPSGTWTDSANQANPQTRSATKSALFFRVKQ